MQNNKKKHIALFGSVNVLVFAALMCALSGVLKLIAPTGTTWRIGLENFPIIFSGIVLGPFVGAVVGTVSDLLGCLLCAYTVNPLITFASMLVGLLSGLTFKAFKTKKSVGVAVSVFVAHLAANAFVKTIALCIWYSTPFVITLMERTATYFITAIVETVILLILFKNKSIKIGLKKLVDHEL